MAICLVLIPSGTSVAKASLWSIFTSLPQPLMAVPAYVFVRMFEPLLPIGLGLAAGAMIWMVFAERVPDASKKRQKWEHRYHGRPGDDRTLVAATLRPQPLVSARDDEGAFRAKRRGVET